MELLYLSPVENSFHSGNPHVLRQGPGVFHIVQSIYLFDPSQIATESFSSPFFSEKHTFHHIKSLEKSKKGKIQNVYCDNTAPQVRHENEAAYSNLLLHGSFDQQFTIIQSLGSKGKDR